MSDQRREIRIPLPRNPVVRAVAIYSAIALLVLLSLPSVLRALAFPDWVSRAMVLAAFGGLVVTALVAWMLHRRGRAV